MEIDLVSLLGAIQPVIEPSNHEWLPPPPGLVNGALLLGIILRFIFMVSLIVKTSANIKGQIKVEQLFYLVTVRLGQGLIVSEVVLFLLTLEPYHLLSGGFWALALRLIQRSMVPTSRTVE
ncbi:hypothetical protein A3A70_02375 [candidate division WWE3 bacterium RIFCSPLOWO2_01_FULL_42_11]|uniref:Uncharacterized protein n=1 Tax=candidate division WWE3 bacterium RIFCSPLOWO2_01_FULL_42_11 TaxID=1802627 RepID=A0A1F4VRT9_UNCKA|nr:MAG: hypothetical protein A3A70_02375 [candidate division WWE3 bacterium RIFCSPLOWO2_01_FULL_42_11]